MLLLKGLVAFYSDFRHPDPRFSFLGNFDCCFNLIDYYLTVEDFLITFFVQFEQIVCLEMYLFLLSFVLDWNINPQNMSNCSSGFHWHPLWCMLSSLNSFIWVFSSFFLPGLGKGLSGISILSKTLLYELAL